MKGQPKMFDRKKDEIDDTALAREAIDEAIASSPPRSNSEATVKLPPSPPSSPTPVSVAEQPRRLPEMPSERGSRPDQSRITEGTELIVGREIVLNGEINSCDRLVVQGKVEATMKNCRELEIAETGTFKGQVEFDRADISGIFEGELTAREHLVVRATGRITGKVRFGELEIERGGQLIGDGQVFGEKAAAARDARVDVDNKAD